MPNTFKVFGGQNIQIQKTVEYLKKNGINVTVSDEKNPNLTNYDVVHIFSGKSFPQLMNALSKRKPVAFTPIFWDPKLNDAIPNYRGFAVINKVHRLISIFKKGYQCVFDRHFFLNNIREDIKNSISFKNLIMYSHILLPQSNLEAEQVMNSYSITKPYHVVPNAADIGFCKSKPDKFVAKYDEKDFVLCVARIEPRKNQLNLIKAIKRTNYTLVLIGPKHKDHTHYFNKCKKFFGNGVLYIPYLDYPMLSSAYAAAKVHVLPSFAETTGLSTIEASLAGCNVIITNRGCTSEYFEDLAIYCDPFSVDSIKESIVKAYNSPFQEELKRKILNNYTWEHTAKEILIGYEKAIKINNGYK
jgi:glycosyltransferase involved in cell wall biosynthesis